MISIIIYSEKNELLAPLCQNIEQTIGVAHEIIIVDKAASPSNICIAYNEAALRTF